MKSEFFEIVENWFKENKAISEKQWAGLTSKYGSENHFGNILRNSVHDSIVDSGLIHEALDFPLYWNYCDDQGFYFNSLGSNITREAFDNLRTRFTQLLGCPDEVFTYYGLKEPLWSQGNVTLNLCHIDSHGNGYERIILRIDKQALKNGT